MAKKPQDQLKTPAARPVTQRSRASIVGGAVLAAAIVGALFMVFRGSLDPAAAPAANPGSVAPSGAPPAEPHAAQTKAVTQRAPEPATAPPDPIKLQPHPQKNLPPLPFAGYPPPRPVEVVKAAYVFAAEHPEILAYVPCYCGCGRQGHKDNSDCFVASRSANGDVLQWDEHGMECAVCIDIAHRSRQMYASGASARDIRTAIEAQYAQQAQTKTATPMPPARK